MNYTYMVRCGDGSLYTGWTNCLEKRLKAHNEGKSGAKYTNKWLRDKGRSFYKGMFEIKKYMTIKWQALPSIMNT